MLRELQMVGMLPDGRSLCRQSPDDRQTRPAFPQPATIQRGNLCNRSVGRAMRNTALAIDMYASAS
ncbi:hypothetical protein M8494_15290 [Serratia ureilytica]